jgi:hypothetical protein
LTGDFDRAAATGPTEQNIRTRAADIHGNGG